MITFAYQARDAAGRIVSGTQEALNQENAISTLMQRGLMVLSITQRGAAKATKASTKVKETDLVLFTRQLATMVDAGLPLTTALSALYEQCDPKRQGGLRSVISDLVGKVQGGETFSGSLARHPKVFNRLYVSMVRAGESGGLLAEILDRLAGFLEATARLKRKVKSAMTYPVIVISICILICLFLIIRVVPVFAEVFADFGSDLPAPTQALVDLSAFMRTYWYIWGTMIPAAIWGFLKYTKTKTGRIWWDQYKLKIPVFGPLIRKIAMTRFARTFAQLIRSGVPILEVLDIIGETSGNHVIETAIRSVKTDVESGDPLAAALSKQEIFPPMLTRMVAAGEATGKIDTMLEKMADFWDEEVEATLDSLTSLIEPMLIIIIGVVVGGMVICLFLPIFQLGDVVS
ncbi:MAG: type II secretion system F family protein [Verrucomicrobiales bacterium]